MLLLYPSLVYFMKKLPKNYINIKICLIILKMPNKISLKLKSLLKLYPAEYKYLYCITMDSELSLKILFDMN